MIFPSPIKFTWLLSLIFHFTFGMGTVSWIIFDMMELLQGYFFQCLKGLTMAVGPTRMKWAGGS